MKKFRAILLSIVLIVLLRGVALGVISQVNPEANQAAIAGMQREIDGINVAQKMVITNQLRFAEKLAAVEATTSINNTLLIAACIGLAGMIIDRVAQMVKKDKP